MRTSPCKAGLVAWCPRQPRPALPQQGRLWDHVGPHGTTQGRYPADKLDNARDDEVVTGTQLVTPRDVAPILPRGV